MRRPLLLALAGLTGCSGHQTPLAPAGDQAASQLWLLQLTLWIGGIVYLIVMAFVGFAVVRALRTRSKTARSAVLEPDDQPLDRTLWIWSAGIIVGLLIIAGGSFWVDRRLAAAQAREALQVEVTAHQWWWRIRYRDPVTGSWIETANELHLPSGRTARVNLGSADVIHSFWVPNVAGKMDVIPGRTNVIDVTPERPGWYRGQCAEFCGLQHAKMAFDVKVDSPAEFDRWRAAQARPAAVADNPEIARGQQIVTQGPCAMCHVVRGTDARGRAGPDLTHLASRRSLAAGILAMNRANLQGWVLQPQALKPGTMMPAIALNADEANAVVRYLEQLK